MNFNYCSTCAEKVISSIRICPNCGNKNFVVSPPIQINIPPTISIQSNFSVSTANEDAKDHQYNGEATSKSKVSSWDWLWQAIAATLLAKFFGLAGALTAILVYWWQQPKVGKLPAALIAAVAGIVVSLLILALIRL